MSKRLAFRQLHQTGCFVLPNPWDVGTTRYLQSMGFQALATTGAGYAFSRGMPDASLTRRQMLAHIAEIVAATDLPVNADFENGFADGPAELVESVRLCLETGVAGLSIEDASGQADEPLYPFELAVERVKAAREAIDGVDRDTVLVARCESFLVGRPDLEDVIRRLQAFAEVGADCLYAPGLKTREQIEAVVKAVAPKPVNVLASTAPGFTLADFVAMGVRRVSVGGALARVAWTAPIKASQEMLQEGRFDALGQAVQVNGFFQKDWAERQG